jgi:hypothetical protein
MHASLVGLASRVHRHNSNSTQAIELPPSCRDGIANGWLKEAQILKGRLPACPVALEEMAERAGKTQLVPSPSPSPGLGNSATTDRIVFPIVYPSCIPLDSLVGPVGHTLPSRPSIRAIKVHSRGRRNLQDVPILWNAAIKRHCFCDIRIPLRRGVWSTRDPESESFLSHFMTWNDLLHDMERIKPRWFRRNLQTALRVLPVTVLDGCTADRQDHTNAGD